MNREDSLNINDPKSDTEFQRSVRMWVEHCFGVEVADDIVTRCFRFFEEAGELCQSLGMRKEDAIKLVEYTWGRPVGEPRQEFGGTMVTLAALATPAGLLMRECGWIELGRCWENTEKIRAKQKSKAAIGLGADPIPGTITIHNPTLAGVQIEMRDSALGKYVTLQQALQVAVDRYLPQQSVWQIVGTRADEHGTHWLCEHRRGGGVAVAIDGIYALPTWMCSSPRDTP